MNEKKKMKGLPKRILSFALTLAMMLTLMPGMSTEVKAETPSNYLTFTAGDAAVKITFNWKSGSDVKYSTDGGSSWTDYTKGTELTLNDGELISFKGRNVVTDDSNHFTMSGEGKIYASGSVTSLTDENGGDSSVELQLECYKSMFSECENLTEAPSLPATNLAHGCYCSMFSDCENLEIAPNLPSTVLAVNCYSEMFSGCESLVTAPDLPATTLAMNCYSAMFRGCTNLVTAPDLPATTLAKGCYCMMFAMTGVEIKYCKTEDFTKEWKIPATENVYAYEGGPSAIDRMFENCARAILGEPNPEYGTPELNTVYYIRGAAPHTHGNWTYNVSENVLTATCGNSNCDLTDSKVTLTLTANSVVYSGNPVTVCTDGTNADAVIKYNLSDWTTAGAEAVTVKYVGRDGTTYDESATAPTKIGKYAVKLYPASEEETRIHVATANFEITRMTDYDGKLIDFADTNWEYKIYTSGSFTSNVAGDTSGTLEKLKFYNISGATVSYAGASFPATPDSDRSDELTPSMIAGLISSVTNGVGVTCTYSASEHTLTITPIVHVHDWKYFATGNKLEAYCANEDCPSGTDATHKVSLTLSATSANYSGSTTGWCEADKVAFELVGKDAWESAVGTAPTIQYTGTTIDGTAYTSEDKPTVGGSYTAYIECDEKKAELSFLVGHVFEGLPYVDEEDGIHHNQKCKYCDNVNQGNHDFSDEGICKICNRECTHQNAEGWTVEDGKCTSCGVEIGYPVDDEGKPVVIDKVPDQLWVTGIRQNLKFTGAKVEQPTMKVYWKNKLLVINRDYKVKYLNNIKAGTATVVITGKGNYAGTIKETYPIEQIDIGSAKAFDEEITIAANGKIQKPTTTFTIEAGGKTVTLKKGTDYTYTYPVIKDKGEYEVTITGKGNYKGTKTVKVTVVDEGVAVTKLTVKKIPNQTYCDEDNDGKGDQIIPDVVVMYGKKILEKGTDYTVEAAGANTDIGTGTVTIVGNSENGYYGKRNISFNIVGTPITKATVKGLVTETYTGNAINPTGYKLYFKATKTKGQIDLTENKDYKVSVDKNVNAGTATVTFTGINGYSGVLKKTFKINKASMTDERISIKPIDAAQYQKNGAKPAITVTDGSKVLKENVDYTVKYTNNKALHDLSNEVKKPTVTITGKGNYVGTKSANFAIIGSSLSKDDITITATDIVASGKANTCKPVIKLTDNGVALKAGTDYETAVEYTYVNATKVKQIVNRVEAEVEYTAGAKVNTADIIPAGTEIRATVKGKGFYADSKEVVFRYVAVNIASAKVVIPSFVYSGKAITLDENKIQVTMVVNKKAETLKFGEDFEIIGYKNNVDKGTAKVTIRGLGNYGGTKEVTFKIVSKTLNHTVRLHNNDGSGKDVVREINIPSGTKLPVNKFKVAGKKFAGWNTEADGSGKAYNDREAIVRSNLSMLIFGDTLDLYAQWE